jgi:hypothetical protein
MQRSTQFVFAGLSVGAVSLTAFPAFAGNYRDAQNNIFVTGLSPQQEVTLSYPGTPKTGSSRANLCGAVIVKGTGGVPLSGTIKVDNASINVSSLPQQILPSCGSNGQFQETRTANFKTYDGSVVVVNKTANSYYAIETQENATRRVRANACGFALIKPNNKFTHAPSSQVGINSEAPGAISSLTQKGAPICRTGVTYYPSDWLGGGGGS